MFVLRTLASMASRRTEPTRASLRGRPAAVDRARALPSVAPRVKHAPEDGRIGVCCSGGGIRSAAYNLGALQVLQSRGVLQDATYLAAVSGGSYIAAAFSIVQKRLPGADEAGPGRNPQPNFDAVPPYAPGSPEERWLRNHSSYMAPGLGGKVGLATRLVLGMLLNLVLVGALVALVALPLGLLGAWLHPQLSSGALGSAPDGVIVLLRTTIVGLGLLGLGLALYAAGARLRDHVEKQLMRYARLLVATAAVAFVVAFALPWTTMLLRALLAQASALGGSATDRLAALTALLAGLGVPPLIISLVHMVMDHAGTTLGRVRRWLVSPKVAAAVAAPMLLVSGVLFAYNVGAGGLTRTVGGAWGVALAAVVLLYLVLDPTSSSLHPTYKRRLSSAFAVYRDEHHNAQERPYEQRVKLSDSKVATKERRWPQLLVCAAANISTEGVTPPGRNAAPFVFSHDEVGGDLVGEVASDDLERALGTNGRDLTLLAAVAMSGAAVSPSMGKMSSKAHTFLLALANARLGVWLPNPRYLTAGGRDTWGPLRLTWLLREMFGWNDLDAKYLYVTDGGHYENLGLLELLRRGCTEIYCFDASGDQGSFATIGQTIALARSELGVDINLNPDALASDTNGDGTTHAIAHFEYAPDAHGHRAAGRLIYAKAAVPTDAPWDIRAYQHGDPDFPNNSTADQLYTDEKFEAYRALGSWSARRALDEARAKTFGKAA